MDGRAVRGLVTALNSTGVRGREDRGRAHMNQVSVPKTCRSIWAAIKLPPGYARPRPGAVLGEGLLHCAPARAAFKDVGG